MPSIPPPACPGHGYDEASADDVAAAVDAAARAFHDPSLRDRDARAALLRGAAARLRAAGDEIVAVGGSETGLPEGRLRSELERTAGQLEAFAAVLDAGDYVEAIIDTPDPARQADPAPRRAAHARADRARGRVRREQLPARLLDRGRRHRVRAGRRLPGRGQGPPVAPRHGRAGRARAAAAAAGRPGCPRARSRTCSPPASRSARRWSTRPRSPPSASPARPPAGARSPTAPRAGRTRSPSTRRWARVNPIVVTDAALAARARGDRRRARRLRVELRRPALHEARRRLRPGRAARATSSPTTSPHGSTASSRPCCSTSACATRSPPRCERLAERPEVHTLGAAPEFTRRGIPPSAGRLRGARVGRRPGSRAARGALRPGRRAAALRRPRRAAGRDRADRGPAHRLDPRAARTRTASCWPR